MYAYIDGIVAEKTTDSIVLEAGGIGYSILVSGACLSACPAAGQRMKVYTVLNVRQDAVDLFGFYSKEEKHMFQRLSGVTGVGPRTALAILSADKAGTVTVKAESAGLKADEITFRAK